MKLDKYKYAKRIMESIEEYDKMDKALSLAVNEVKASLSESDAENVTKLIMELVKTKNGERVLDRIICMMRMECATARRKLNEEFEAL